MFLELNKQLKKKRYRGQPIEIKILKGMYAKPRGLFNVIKYYLKNG